MDRLGKRKGWGCFEVQRGSNPQHSCPQPIATAILAFIYSKLHPIHSFSVLHSYADYLAPAIANNPHIKPMLDHYFPTYEVSLCFSCLSSSSTTSSSRRSRRSNSSMQRLYQQEESMIFASVPSSQRPPSRSPQIFYPLSLILFRYKERLHKMVVSEHVRMAWERYFVVGIQVSSVAWHSLTCSPMAAWQGMGWLVCCYEGCI